MKSEISRKTLKNGLRLLHIKNKENKLWVEINFKVGAENETADISGISHYLEHVICEGSQEYSGDKIRDEMKKLDGDFNASTSLKRTSYFFRIQRKHFEKSLEMLSSIIQNPLIDESQVAKEKSIILNEMKQRKDHGHCEIDLFLLQGLFEKHPLSNDIIGDEDNIQNMTPQKLRGHYEKYYAPNNALITVTGNIEDPTELIEKYFTFQPKQIPKDDFIAPTQIKQKLIQKKGDTKTTYLSIGFQTAPTTHQDSNVLAVIEKILEHGKEINLMDEVRHKRALTYSIWTTNRSYKETGFFSIQMTTEKEKVPEASKAILEQLKKLETITTKEVENAKKKEIKDRNRQIRMPITLHNLLINCELFNYWKEYENRKENIECITAEDVQRVAKQYFTENYTQAIIEQGEKTSEPKKEC